LFGTQLGGGTDINRAVTYCRQQITRPTQTIFILISDLYEGGADPYLQVVTAQTTLLFNQRNEIDILRRQMDASVLLIKAIGGGWNASQLPPTSTLP